MEVKNGKSGSSEVWKGSKRSQSKGEPTSMGTFSDSSSEPGSFEIRVSREDSDKPNTVVPAGKQSLDGITGKIIRQLVDETEKQLAYHKEQVKALEERAEELKQLSKEYTDIEPE